MQVDQSPKPDSFIRFQIRRLATGMGWAVFGLGALSLALTWFPCLNLFVRNKKARVRTARKTISASFKLYFNFLKLIGAMNYDTDSVHELNKVKGSIIIANHPTILDYVFMASQMPEVDCLVKAELKNNFFLKGVVKAVDYLLNDSSNRLIEECRKRLAEGENILIFPEGTRTKPNQPIKLKRGVAQIALRCECNIEVVRIHCSDRWLDKSSQWYEIPKSKPTITLQKGQTVKVAGFINDSEESFSLAARRLTAHLKKLLEDNLGKVNKQKVKNPSNYNYL